MLNFLGGLIGAGSSLLGGLFGQQNQAAINQQNVQAQEQINQQNIAEQEKFAQQGVQWKVADAKAAGINPLAALGANTGSFSNVVAPQAQSSNAFGTGVAGAGQDISRAINATRSAEDQAIAAQKTALDLEGMQLDNDLKRASIASSVARTRQAGVPPGIPDIVGDHRPNPQALPGAQTDYTVYRDAGGNLVTEPSKEFQQGAFGNEWAMMDWAMRNRVMPTFGFNVPPDFAVPEKGNQWFRNPFTGRWYQSKSWGNAWGGASGSDVSDWMRGGGLS